MKHEVSLKAPAQVFVNERLLKQSARDRRKEPIELIRDMQTAMTFKFKVPVVVLPGKPNVLEAAVSYKSLLAQGIDPGRASELADSMTGFARRLLLSSKTH